MSIMLLDHTCIGMAEVFRNDLQWHAAHEGMAGIGVSQCMEIGARLDFCSFAGLS